MRISANTRIVIGSTLFALASSAFLYLLPPSPIDRNLVRGTFYFLEGHAYQIPVKYLDGELGAARLYEDDRLLGPANSDRQEIAAKGGGRFQLFRDTKSFFGPVLLLSTSDNTDPNTNGRKAPCADHMKPGLRVRYWAQSPKSRDDVSSIGHVIRIPSANAVSSAGLLAPGRNADIRGAPLSAHAGVDAFVSQRCRALKANGSAVPARTLDLARARAERYRDPADLSPTPLARAWTWPPILPNPCTMMCRLCPRTPVGHVPGLNTRPGDPGTPRPIG